MHIKTLGPKGRHVLTKLLIVFRQVHTNIYTSLVGLCTVLSMCEYVYSFVCVCVCCDDNKAKKNSHTLLFLF